MAQATAYGASEEEDEKAAKSGGAAGTPGSSKQPKAGGAGAAPGSAGYLFSASRASAERNVRRLPAVAKEVARWTAGMLRRRVAGRSVCGNATL